MKVHNRIVFAKANRLLFHKAIKHPQAPEGAKKVVPLFSGARNFFLRMRSAVAVLRQSDSHARCGS